VVTSNELVERLSAAAGMIMVDNGPLALTPLPLADQEVDTRLNDLSQACEDAGALVQAAQVLARRGIR
jgi:hypothetical protein